MRLAFKNNIKWLKVKVGEYAISCHTEKNLSFAKRMNVMRVSKEYTLAVKKILISQDKPVKQRLF